MDQMELLMEIREDVASIKANMNNVCDDVQEVRKVLDTHDTRIKRLELIVLPIVAVVSFLGIVIF